MTGDLPTQPSLRRMREFGVRPRRDLGQNFLVDSNILGVIERAAALSPDDVVLEIGGGLGVLSEHLAPRCAHVHVVELDRALVPALEDALTPQVVRKERNQPAFVAHTARFVAERRSTPYAEFDRAVERTAADLLSW